jgi:hypothetical protein
MPRREKAARLSRKGPKAGQGLAPSLVARAGVAAVTQQRALMEKIMPPRQSKMSKTKKDSLDEASRASTPDGRMGSPKTLPSSRLLAPSFTELSCLNYVELEGVPVSPGGL